MKNIIQKIEQGEFELYLHDKQKDDCITGEELYKHLQDNNLLDGCATEDDLKEIQAQGIVFFKKYFDGKYIYAWKNLVRNRSGNLSVPFLYEDGGLVVLLWHWAGNIWSSGNPALRHASTMKNEHQCRCGKLGAQCMVHNPPFPIDKEISTALYKLYKVKHVNQSNGEEIYTYCVAKSMAEIDKEFADVMHIERIYNLEFIK